MSTIAHLYLAFQIIIDLFQNNIAQDIIVQAITFIQEFKIELHHNIESFSEYIDRIEKMEELSHLKGKLPTVPIDLCLQIETLKSNFCGQFRAQNRNKEIGEDNFSLNKLLNIEAAVAGHKIPIPFKTYEGFATACHEHFDFVMIQKSFRNKLGQQYQAELLRRKDLGAKN